MYQIRPEMYLSRKILGAADSEYTSMGVLDTVSELFGSGEQHYRFRCDDCGTEFAQRVATVEDLTCPDCGAETVRPAEAA
ncbi:putative regulatory protein, FmdB family [Haloarcula vallismortis]|uniref:Putative regulatory protein, FmdB family n=2 Tax=Haloarcula vallismortis TaxID=28442 RepID=A0A1H2Q8J1_HALVA|nr:putative regulatory protein, FmdB family [Haloarcula vallismortis]